MGFVFGGSATPPLQGDAAPMIRIIGFPFYLRVHPFTQNDQF